MRSRKHLKVISIIILIFAGFTLINVVSEFAFGDTSAIMAPEGTPEGIISALKGIIFGASLLLLLPQIYIGVKGIKVANHPDFSKGHIAWAIILLIIAFIALVFPIVGLIQMNDVIGNISTMLSAIVDIIIYFCYIKYAKAASRAR